jgi:hypothetical protein
LKKKTSGKLLRYLNSLVQGILFYIKKKTSCSFGRGCALKNKNVLQNNPASNIVVSAKYPELHILNALYLISPFRG